MASCSLTVSLLVSLVFMRFVSAADPTIIQATAGENIVLPCIDPDPGEIIVIEWRRTDLEKYVLRYRDGRIESENQDPSYQNRVDLNVNQMKDGNFSLILKNVTIDDSGMYECRVAKANIEKKPISTVKLVVTLPPPPPPPDPFPVWAKVLLVLVLVLVAAPVLIFWLWHHFSVHKVEVEPGVESVLLPWRWGDQLVSCWFTSRLPGDVRVEWRDDRDWMVHVTRKGSDCSAEQNQSYRNRTKMDKNLSLTLKRPTCEDNGFYTCTVYRGDGVVLMKKDVLLKVKVQQVEVEPGKESVELPWRTTGDLDGDIRVEWKDREGDVVHVYQDGSDQPDVQHLSYKGRTKMDENPLKTKNLSLTLMDPTYSDSYICRVYRGGTVLMVKQVQLEVKDQQVEEEEGAESVKLEFKVTFDLLGGDKVEWKDSRGRMVHVYQIGSDQPVEQAEFYRTRTKMDENLLETKDVSLTLIKPTKEDSGDYGCQVYRNGERLRMKTFQLNIKAKRNLDQPEETRTNQKKLY